MGRVSLILGYKNIRIMCLSLRAKFSRIVLKGRKTLVYIRIYIIYIYLIYKNVSEAHSLKYEGSTTAKIDIRIRYLCSSFNLSSLYKNTFPVFVLFYPVIAVRLFQTSQSTEI